MMDRFILKSKYKPCGDQPQAIESLTEGLNDGLRTQVLLGVTGSGKPSLWQTLSLTCKGLRWS